MSITWLKIKKRHDRIDLLRKIFDEQVLEFTEDNLATNVMTFVEDALTALPQSAKRINVEALVDAAVKDWRENR